MSDSSSLVRCHHSCFRVDRGQGIAIRARSRGFVHIFFALAVFLGISVWGISEVLRYVTETRQTAEQRELESLHRARRALINYAFLPPPDLPGQDGAFNVFGFETVVNGVTVTNNYEFRHYELPCPDVLDVREVRDGGEVYIDGSEVNRVNRAGEPIVLLDRPNRLPDWTGLRIIPGCLCAARRAIRWNPDRGLGVFRGAVCRGRGLFLCAARAARICAIPPKSAFGMRFRPICCRPISRVVRRLICIIF